MSTERTPNPELPTGMHLVMRHPTLAMAAASARRLNAARGEGTHAVWAAPGWSDEQPYAVVTAPSVVDAFYAAKAAAKAAR